MTQHDKAPELVERLKVVARCGTDSTMRHSAYAFMAQNPDGDYVTHCAYADLAEENRRLREALALLTARAGSLVFAHHHGNGLEGWHKVIEGVDCALTQARSALSSTGEKV